MRQNNFRVDTHKTDKVNVDEKVHGLPPSNGTFQEFKVADYFCPDEWSKDAIFIPVSEGEPMWFDLRGNDESACLPSVQRLNPVIGEPANLDDGLTKDPRQNYLALPVQKWIDGYAKDGKVYQFVATKRGVGLAVNEYVLPEHMQDSHAIGFAFYAPKNPKPKIVYQDRPRFKDSLCGSAFDTPKWHLCSKTKPKNEHWNYSNLRSTSSGTYQSLGGTLNSISPENTAHAIYGNEGNDDQVGSAVTDFDGDGCIDHLDAVDECLVSCNAASEITDEPAVTSTTSPILMAATATESAVVEELQPTEAPEIVDMLEERKLQDLDQASMGMGGRIDQKIIPDENTVDYYHEKPDAILTIYLALPDMFKAIMDKGLRQDKTREDKYKMSGDIGGIQVPLIVGDEAS